MSESTSATCLVRDRDGVRQFEFEDDWEIWVLLGSLSADPRSFDELARARMRYRTDGPLEELSWTNWAGSESLQAPEQPAPEMWGLIDLVEQKVVVSDEELSPKHGAYSKTEGPIGPHNPLIYVHMPEHWTVEVSDQFPTSFASPPVFEEPLDFRGVLFGRPLAGGLARRACQQVCQHGPPPPIAFAPPSYERLPEPERSLDKKWYAITKKIHADWYMTAREDLGGLTPRHFLHHQRQWMDEEMQDRRSQWQEEKEAPRALDRDTYAYRYGPMGLEQVQVYFDYCRELIRYAWQRLHENPEMEAERLAAVMYDHGQLWLEREPEEGEIGSPAAIIESERSRIPLTANAVHLDCDCPLCRLSAEGAFSDNPVFVIADGHHLELEEEFAFSLETDHRFWETQYGESSASSAETSSESPNGDSARDDDEAEVDKTEPGSRGIFSSDIWERSYVNQEMLAEEGPDSPVAIMAIGSRIAELIADLKEGGTGGGLIDTLNKAFDLYRSTPGGSVLRRSATCDLIAVLEEIAKRWPRLTAKSADLQSQLDQLERQAR